MGRRGIAVLVAAGIAASAACFDTGGLEGTGETTDAADQIAPDTNDASQDPALHDAEADAPPFCATRDAALCLDFDEGPTLTTYFSEINPDPKVAFAVDGGELVASFDGGTLDAGYINSSVHRVILGTTMTTQTRVEISFKLEIEAVDPSKAVRLCSVEIEQNGGQLFFELQTSEGGSALVEEYIEAAGVLDGSFAHALVTPLAVGKPLSIRIVIDGAAGVANAYVDDVLSTQSLAFDPGKIVSGAPSIYFDLLHYDAVGTPSTLGATRFRIDDALVQVR